MSMALRMLLLAASFLTCAYITRKLKKSQIQVMDTVFWISMSLIFVVLSIFPNIASVLSKWMGFQAPVNFIFLLIIFLILVRCFLMSPPSRFLALCATEMNSLFPKLDFSMDKFNP